MAAGTVETIPASYQVDRAQTVSPRIRKGLCNNLGILSTSTQSTEPVPCPCPTLKTYLATTVSRDEPNNINPLSPHDVPNEAVLNDNVIVEKTFHSILSHAPPAANGVTHRRTNVCEAMK